MTNLRENFATVRRRIIMSARRVGLSLTEVKLVVVSKTYPTEILQAAIEAGATDLGENKVQEAEMKISELGRAAAQWHLIGSLQANKARKAVRLFDVIHSLDSVELALRLERICAEENRRQLDVLVQVDLANEATKSGIAEKELPRLVETLQDCQHLNFRGLMILPPFFEDSELARPFFRRLREIRDKLQADGVFGEKSGELSMGMSNDFETAIEEGATIVRVGTAIFGKRQKS